MKRKTKNKKTKTHSNNPIGTVFNIFAFININCTPTISKRPAPNMYINIRKLFRFEFYKSLFENEKREKKN